MSWVRILSLALFPIADVLLQAALQRNGHVAHLMLHRDLRIIQLSVRLAFVLYVAHLLTSSGVP